ncbi:MAG: sporulation protein YqfD, partial [Bacilli bacterium]|nr:sporulation protein YqfD [Bacilli bacterium]
KREEIKRKILEKEKERIEWLEIEKIGTVYQIKIEERKIKKEEEECTPRNLVARKNATIIEIESEKGEIKVKKNDYVEKNQVLISGFIYNKDKIVSKRCAIGKVYGEVWYKVKVNIPKYYEKKIKQEEITRNIKLKIGKKYYYFPKNNKNITEKEYNIIDSKIIPFSLSIEKRRNIKSKKKQYTYEELDKIAKLVVEKDFQKRLKEKEEILEKKVLKKMEFNSKIIVEVFLKVKEEITEVQSIEELNIDEINQETE